MLDRWNPFAEISRLQDELFNENRTPTYQGGFRPRVDIRENEKDILIDAELPGVKLEDVDLQVEKGVLTLKGERKLEKEDEKEGYHRVERFYGSFTRSFALPDTVDAEHIDAKLKDGILHLTLPKREAAKPKKIAVTAHA